MTTRDDATHAPSIRDVAKIAGVSYQTVSRVLNNHPSIRPGTRQRVLDAIESLNFRPNRAARVLATNRSRLIGLLASVNGSYYGPTSTISAIEDAAREAGYAMLLANPRTIEADTLAEAVEHLIREGVEGIVVLAPQSRTAEIISAVRDPIPAVFLQTNLRDVDLGLSVDNELGAALAIQHLIEQGHTRIAMVSGPADWSEAGARTQGVLARLGEAGLELVASAEGDWTPESGYSALERLSAHEYTAVFCANDQMALGFIHAAFDRGIRVPDDISVVGFDDIPESAHFLPPLTTIRQDFDELGRRGMSTLLGRIEGNPREFERPIPPTLVVRSSTRSV